MQYLTEPLKAGLNKSAFSCGIASLDNYIQKQASQDMKRKLSVVFVMIDDQQPKNIKGYYTLSNDNIDYNVVPDDIKKKMPPHYTNLPVTLLGRLAVNKKHQGQGIGEKLLLDALKRSFDVAETNIGSIAVVVDPIDNNAQLFYEQYGFILLPDCNRMFLPMLTIKTIWS